jgi:hypothetical protein
MLMPASMNCRAPACTLPRPTGDALYQGFLTPDEALSGLLGRNISCEFAAGGDPAQTCA